MKDLQKLAGAKILSKKEQQEVKGGKMQCPVDGKCPSPMQCIDGICQYGIE